ncbi:MAG TPA: DotU family type IV/VI secretion system protein [Thermoanaerobaculia bacterium]|nr:DotU family type IV/VI secretion system protein [Thermoanaerobaculia bacterium]
MSDGRTTSLLGAQFEELYGELLRFKARAMTRGEGSLDPEGTEAVDTLASLLERQALAHHAGRGDVGAELQRQAHYVMAAVVDELFLKLDWPGREAWKSHLLEARLFGSHRAGEVFFSRLDKLLAWRDPIYTDLATVYLVALGLGFQGKFRGRPEAERELALYRQRLFRMLHGRDPGLAAQEGPLIPQAYAATLGEGTIRQLSYLKTWGLVAVGVIALWLAASVWIWGWLAKDLRSILETILG